MRFHSLDLKDPLEKETATCPSILAWKIPRTEEPGVLQYVGSKRVVCDWAHIDINTHTFCFVTMETEAHRS